MVTKNTKTKLSLSIRRSVRFITFAIVIVLQSAAVNDPEVSGNQDYAKFNAINGGRRKQPTKFVA